MSSQKPWYEKAPALLDEAAVEDADLACQDARFLSSSSRRVLPMPGSPATTANWQSPEIAAFKRRWSSANSFSRPMNAERAGLWIIRLGLEDDRHPELFGREARLVPPQRLGHLAGLLGALGRVLLEAAQDDVLELLPDLGAQRAGRLRDLVDDAVEDRLQFAREGRIADEAFVEDGAERVDVRPRVEGARGDLLGGEVGHRADQRAGLRQARLGVRAGEAEVHDAHADGGTFLPRDHDVGRLDVPVDDAARVAVVEGVGDLDADVDDVAQMQRLLPNRGAAASCRRRAA